MTLELALYDAEKRNPDVAGTLAFSKELILQALLNECCPNDPASSSKLIDAGLAHDPLKRMLTTDFLQGRELAHEPEAISTIWDNQDLMDPYSKAIEKIKGTLNTCFQQKAPEEYVQNGFEGWPTPNPFYDRTPMGIYLETESYERGEKLSHLWTPFGKVTLLGGGSLDALIRMSKLFLHSMKWEITEVSEKVAVYSYSQKTNSAYGPSKFHNEPYKGAGTKSRLYFIKTIEDQTFEEPKSWQIFSRVN